MRDDKFHFLIPSPNSRHKYCDTSNYKHSLLVVGGRDHYLFDHKIYGSIESVLLPLYLLTHSHPGK